MKASGAGAELPGFWCDPPKRLATPGSSTRLAARFNRTPRYAKRAEQREPVLGLGTTSERYLFPQSLAAARRISLKCSRWEAVDCGESVDVPLLSIRSS